MRRAANKFDKLLSYDILLYSRNNKKVSQNFAVTLTLKKENTDTGHNSELGN